MKTIAIIGGMGPQASVFAHSQLNKELIKQNKRANIVHVSLDIEPFHSSKPQLRLTVAQQELLWPYQG
jgi:aspartate/glutamate racemase